MTDTLNRENLRNDPADTVVETVLTVLDDGKARDIVSISLAGKSSIADYMVIASGSSSRQLSALAEHLQTRLKEDGAGRVVIEGSDGGDWILIDAGDVIVHLFHPEMRELYQLEKMWSSGDDEPVTIRAGAATGTTSKDSAAL